MSSSVVSSEIESHSVLLFAGLTEANEPLNDEMCRFLLNGERFWVSLEKAAAENRRLRVAL